MSRRNISSWLACAVLAAGVLALSGEEPKSSDKASKPEGSTAKTQEPVDIVATVREWNSDKFASPPTKFREGKVTPRQLDDKAITSTKEGFTIKLPSGAPIPTPTVYKGKLYVSGGFHSKEYYCFDAESGKLVWAVNLDDDGPTSSVCEDGVVLFNTESCTIFALDAETGKQLWSLFLGDPLTSTPTVANGKVFTSYPARNGGEKQPPCSHVLAAFELKTGKILWQKWIDSDVMSAPVAVDKELYATSFAGTVYKLNQEDGKLVSAVKSRATSAPVVVGNSVYQTRRTDDGKGRVEEAVTVGEKDQLDKQKDGEKKLAEYLDSKVQDKSQLKGSASALDAGNGFAGGAPQAANPLAAKDNIGQSNVSSMQAFQGSRILHYRDNNFNCMGDEIICTDPATGKRKWGVKLEGDLKKEGGFLASPPAAAGGKLFLTTLNGEILQVDPADGKISERYKVGSPIRFQPAIEGGEIYVGTQDGKVICIHAGDKKFTGWPCWGGNPAHTGLPAKEDK
jgi:outer membrane protein assembly factor BamB